MYISDNMMGVADSVMGVANGGYFPYSDNKLSRKSDTAPHAPPLLPSPTLPLLNSSSVLCQSSNVVDGGLSGPKL